MSSNALRFFVALGFVGAVLNAWTHDSFGLALSAAGFCICGACLVAQEKSIGH